MIRQKQLVIKPQDYLVSLKIAVSGDKERTFSELGQELFMSVSEVHAATERAITCRLLTKDSGQLRAINNAIEEFTLHGVRYVFPPIMGSLTRGVPTGTAAHPLKKYFPQGDMLELVWPDSAGQLRGIGLQPIYPSVPAAASVDSKLYELLVLVDAFRIGAAREREIASTELRKYLI